MPENAILLHVDDAENYENMQQGECQSAYFGYTPLTIFFAATYTKLNGKTDKVSIVIVAKDHSPIASHSCILKAIETVTDILIRIELVLSIFIFGKMVTVHHFNPGLYFS